MNSFTLVLFIGLLFAPTVRTASTWSALPQAWIYPGAPACNAANEYKDGRRIHTLKPEYYTVTSSGDLEFLTVDSAGCNAYSAANVAELKQYSTEQYVTVSGGGNPLVTSATKRAAAVTTLVAFAVSSGFTGVELDFEGFGQWKSAEYTGYLAFVTALGNALHAVNKKLIIDGPAIFSTQSQGWFLWKYEDFESLPVDYLLIMAYDYQYDYACGTPVAPNTWVTNIISWVKAKISNTDRIIMGIPSYGYTGTLNGYDVTVKTKAQSTSMTKYSSAARQSDSYEMSFTNGQTVAFYQDTAGMNSKRQLIESLGIKRVSVWHLGGNDWFTGTEPSFTVAAGTSSTSTSGNKGGTSSTTRTATSSTSSTTRTATSSTSGRTSTSSTSSSCVCQNQRSVDENGNAVENGDDVQAVGTDGSSTSKFTNKEILALSMVGAVIGIAGMIIGTVVGVRYAERNSKQNNRFSLEDSDDERDLLDIDESPKKGVNKRRQTEVNMDTPEMNVHSIRRSSMTPDPLRKATLTKEATARLAPTLAPMNDTVDK